MIISAAVFFNFKQVNMYSSIESFAISLIICCLSFCSAISFVVGMNLSYTCWLSDCVNEGSNSMKVCACYSFNPSFITDTFPSNTIGFSELLNSSTISCLLLAVVEPVMSNVKMPLVCNIVWSS